MTPAQTAELHLEWTCCGNRDAMAWLRLWREYVHAIDDIEDEETTPEFRLRTFVLALELYTHPFFRAHEARLKQVVLNCTNAYADVRAWEESKVEWQQGFVDWYRHFPQEMVIAVAQICGGYDHARAISLRMRESNYREHHDAEGNQV